MSIHLHEWWDSKSLGVSLNYKVLHWFKCEQRLLGEYVIPKIKVEALVKQSFIVNIKRELIFPCVGHTLIVQFCCFFYFSFLPGMNAITVWTVFWLYYCVYLPCVLICSSYWKRCNNCRLCQCDWGCQSKSQCLIEWRHKKLRLGFWVYVPSAWEWSYCSTTSTALHDWVYTVRGFIFL